MFGISKSSVDTTRVSFRLSEQAADALGRHAEECGKSHGICARDIVVSALTADDEDRLEIQLIRAELAEIRRELAVVRKLRTDLASAVNILLVHAGKLEPDDAREWVNETLLDQ